MGVKCVVWDLDGTLLNSKAGITGGIKRVIERFGLPEQPDKLLNLAVGPTLENTIEGIFGLKGAYRPEMEAFMDIVYAGEGMLLDTLFDGVADCAKLVKERGGTNCVATMRPQRLMERSMECNPELRECIDCWTGREELPGRSTKEELFLTSLEMSGVTQSEAVAIGDRASDILAARAVSIVSVAVMYGFGGKDELESSLPDYTVEDATELRALLEKLLDDATDGEGGR